MTILSLSLLGVLSVIIYTALGGVLKNIYAMYTKETEKAILKGRELPTIGEIKEGEILIGDVFGILFITTIFTIGLVVISTIYPIVGVVTGVMGIILWLINLFTASRHNESRKVLGFLRKNPELLKTILNDKEHRYHEVALSL